MYCFKCGLEIQLDSKPRSSETCPRCDSYLHCCLNCRFYSVTSAHQCREPMAIPQRLKDAGNNCHFFQLSEAKPSDEKKQMDSAKKKLDDLFKK